MRPIVPRVSAAAVRRAMALVAAAAAATSAVSCRTAPDTRPSPVPATTGGVTAAPPVQASASAAASFPELDGYTASVDAAPSPAVDGGTVTVRSWSSSATGCSVRAEVASDAQPIVPGGGDQQDDRDLSEARADDLGAGYQSYAGTSRNQLTGLNNGEPYAGIVSSFTARVDGSDATGKSFVRVWSADGVALSAVETCPQDVFDDAAWSALIRGIGVAGLSGSSRWPGGEPTTSPDHGPGASPAPEEPPPALDRTRPPGPGTDRGPGNERKPTVEPSRAAF